VKQHALLHGGKGVKRFNIFHISYQLSVISYQKKVYFATIFVLVILRWSAKFILRWSAKFILRWNACYFALEYKIYFALECMLFCVGMHVILRWSAKFILRLFSFQITAAFF